MGVRYEWLTALPDVAQISIESPWTWDEYRVVTRKVLDEMGAIPRPVANIVDVSRMGMMPRGDIMGNLRYVEQNMPENTVASVIVGAPMIVTTFMNILTKMRPKAKSLALFASSTSDALSQIQTRFVEARQEANVHAGS
ncbi:MAG: hypothetical protein ABI947_23905 [Chloroflexota bacterium]